MAVSPGAAEAERRGDHGEWERKPQTKEASFSSCEMPKEGPQHSPSGKSSSGHLETPSFRKN